MNKPKTLPKKLIGDNLRVRLILNEDEGMNKASIGGVKAQERRANVFKAKKSEYTYHLDRIFIAAVISLMVLGGIVMGMRALLTHSTQQVAAVVTAEKAPLAATDSAAEKSTTAKATRVVASPENVARAALASSIRGGVPKTELKQTFVSLKKLPSRYVYFFTEVNGLKGKTLYHAWKYRGKKVTEIKIKVGDSAWRSYSGKAMSKKKLGAWEVTLLDDKRNVLASRGFVLVK